MLVQTWHQHIQYSLLLPPILATNKQQTKKVKSLHPTRTSILNNLHVTLDGPIYVFVCTSEYVLSMWWHAEHVNTVGNEE